MAFGDNQIDGYGEDEEKPLAFHHQSGEYRKTEPQFAQDLASGKMTQKRGFFRVLVSTRGNRSMFLVLCISFAIIILMSIFGKNSYEGTVDDIACNLTSFSFEDKLYVTLELEPPAVAKNKKRAPYGGPKQVSATFALINTDKAESLRYDDSCVYEGSQCYIRETFEDYDIAQVKCTVAAGGKSAVLTAKVVQR